MTTDDHHTPAFGRRGLATPVVGVEQTTAAGGAYGGPQLVALLCAGALFLAFAAGLIWALLAVETLRATSAVAQDKVVAIVNQPITHLPRSGQPALFSPGWFHDGAMRPDFDTVDVRLTQQLIYKDAQYVSSDLNPSEMFIGSELEFNSMTKYFYSDRTLPKKRLSENEMEQVNSLYRVVGHAEDDSVTWWTIIVALGIATICLGLALYQILRGHDSSA